MWFPLFAIIAAGAGMLFSGREYAEKQRGFTKDIAALKRTSQTTGRLIQELKTLRLRVSMGNGDSCGCGRFLFVAALYDEIMGRFFLL